LSLVESLFRLSGALLEQGIFSRPQAGELFVGDEAVGRFLLGNYAPTIPT
jgi:hypothetical protein